MPSPFESRRGITADYLLQEADEMDSRVRLIRLFVGAFLAISIMITLTAPAAAVLPMRLARWGSLACAGVLTFGYILRSPLSRQGAAWLVSGLYALGTIIYTVDVPATVLRSVTFIALTIAAFTGGSICYREQGPTPHHLPDRIGITLALLAVPSCIGWILGSPGIFFQGGGYLRGVFVHSNTLGAFGAMWLVVSVGAYDSRLTRHRNLALIGSIAMMLCLTGSKSRAGLGASIISIFFYILVTRQMSRLLIGGLFAGTILLTVFVMLPYASEATMRESSDFIFKGNEEDVLTSRRDVWDTGWQNFYSSPWVGHGFGTSVGEETKEWKLIGLGGREKGNGFLAVLEETGLFGALVMCFPLGLCVASGIRLRRLNLQLVGTAGELRSDARQAAAFWAGAMGGIVNNLAEATIWSPGAVFGGMLLFLAGASEGLMFRTEGRL
jgi:O-antigen ligase